MSEKAGSSLVDRFAKFAVCAPLLAVAIGLGAGALQGRSGADEAIRWIVGGIDTLLILAGFLLAVCALVGYRKLHARRFIFYAALGLVVNALLLAYVGTVLIERGQIGSSERPAASAPLDEDGWVEVRTPGGMAAVHMPRQPSLHEERISRDHGLVTARTYSCELGKASYVLTYLDLFSEQVQLTNAERMEFVVQQCVEMLSRDPTGEVLRREPVRNGAHEGIEQFVNIADGPAPRYTFARVFVVDTVLLVAQVVVDRAAYEAGRQSFDDDVAHFFGSLRLAER